MHLDNLTSMFSLLLIFAFAALGYLVWPNQAVIHEEQKGFCAVIGPRLSPADLSGKSLFHNNCAQCHAKNLKSNATGPALFQFFGKWNNDTITLHKYLSNAPEFESSSMQARLIKEYGSRTGSHTFQFNAEELSDLLNFIDQ